MPLDVSKLRALDCETHPIRRGQLAPKLVCVSWASPAGGADLLHRDPALGRPNDPGCEYWVEAQLAPGKRIVGHNISFDMAVLANQYPRLLPLIFEAYAGGRIYDTMIAERMLDIAAGRSLKIGKYSLDGLAQKYLDKTLDKSEDSWRMRYEELTDTPLAQWPAGAESYAVEDAKATLGVFQEQLADLGGPIGLPEDALDNMPEQAYTAFCLHLAACWGIHTDPVYVERLRTASWRRLQLLRLTLLSEELMRWERRAKDGQPGYVRNVKVARARMRDTGSKIRTEKGNLSIGAVACKLCGDPVLEAFGEYGRTQSLLTRLDTLAQGYDEPLQSRYVVPLETGRTSCRKPAKNGALRGDQMQNVPASVQGFRECFVPSASDRVLLIGDYGGMELATFAQAALVKVGHSKRAELINAGMDLHLYLAASELGCSYDEICLRYKQGDPVVRRARTRAKPANFGFLGGMGIETYTLLCRDKYDMVVTEEEARKQKLAVVRAFTETAPYFAAVDREVRARGMLRAIRSGRYRGGCNYTAGCNHYFQSLGADMANDAVRRVTRACYAFDGPLYGSRLVVFVHDELVLDTPRAKYREAAARLKQLMEDAAREWLPDVLCTVEPIAAERWSKRAEGIRDADGGLGIWEQDFEHTAQLS